MRCVFGGNGTGWKSGEDGGCGAGGGSSDCAGAFVRKYCWMASNWARGTKGCGGTNEFTMSAGLTLMSPGWPTKWPIQESRYGHSSRDRWFGAGTAWHWAQAISAMALPSVRLLGTRVTGGDDGWPQP